MGWLNTLKLPRHFFVIFPSLLEPILWLTLQCSDDGALRLQNGRPLLVVVAQTAYVL